MKQNNLKNKVKYLLLELNMTQTQLADKIGVHKQVVANWLSGSRNPKLDNLKKLAKALNIPVVELMDDDIRSEIKINKSNVKIEDAEMKIKELEERIKFKDEQIKFLKDKIKFLEKK